MPKRIILTHEDADHVWGNQLFPGAEIIAHQSVLPEGMKQVAEPKDRQQLQRGIGNVIKNFVIKVAHPGLQLHKLSGEIAEKIGQRRGVLPMLWRHKQENMLKQTF